MIEWKPGDRAMVVVAEEKWGDVVALAVPGGGSAVRTDALHPLPTDPHAGLRDAVVEAARSAVVDYRMMGAHNNYVDRMGNLCRAIDALNAAMKPVDPWDELLAASKPAVALEGYCHADRERLSAAIAAVEATGRE